MKDVFESTESELDELEKQNDLLKDQLLEASLKHDVEMCVLLNHKCVDKILSDELDQVKKKSFKIQEGLQSIIKILEKDLEKLENENVSLDFKVQSLIKERDNVKIKFQKLFDSIKKTRSQTQKEMDELIVHVSKKTYAYGAIRAENQDLLSTIFELKTRLEKVEKGMNVTSRVRRPTSKDSSVTNNVLVNSKKAAKNVSVYVRKNKQKDNTSANVISNKENVIAVDVANASKAKTLLCVSCMQNVLIPCHDKCLAKHKLNVRSNVRRTFSTNSRTPKSLKTTYVAPKTRFSKKETQSKTLDTTSIVSKSKIDVESDSKAKDKVSSTSKIKKTNLRDKPLSTCIKNKIRTSRIWQKWFESQPNFIWTPVNIKPNVANTRSSEKPSVSIKKWVVKLPSCPSVVSSCVAGSSDHSVAKVCKIRTGNGIEFKNATLKAHYEKLGIMQQFSIARTPQQNGVVERCNRTLVEAARTMLIFSKLPEFLWAQAVVTACFTQNRSIIHTRYNKTPYELLRGQKPNIAYFHVFGSLCYPTNDRDDLGKMKPKADIGLFIGYSETSTSFRIYNRRTKMIMETIHFKFDELTTMASEHDCLEPELQRFNNHNSSAEQMNTPSKEDLDNLFGPMFEEYYEQKSSDTTIYFVAQPTQVHDDSPSTYSIIVDTREAPLVVTTFDEQTSPISLTEADEFNQEDTTDFDGNAQFVRYNLPSHEEIESSTTALEPSNVQNFHQVQPSTHI
ncbi:retrovirus-related pol polyprotein from transposon TNT 1-94 [Tanacetum coccineum]